MNKTQLLFIIILIEGYVVLATELLAIRQLIPFVGSGTETISIVISAVLMPLAVGYHAGGSAFSRNFRRIRHTARHAHLSVRKLLLKNITTALIILSIGLSYLFMEIFFGLMVTFGITDRLVQTAVYSCLFLVYPVFLLGQTVPLVSNYFSRHRLSEITGKMLFFSTTGSFLGSVFSTIVLMTTIGVHNTVVVTLGLLVILSLLLVRRFLAYETLLSLFIFGMLLTLNGKALLDGLHIVSNNAYNIVSIVDVPEQDATIFNVNRSASSKIAKNPNNNFGYWKYIQSEFLDPIATGSEPKEILVLGAGGFTIGLHDTFNHYTFVDIDKALEEVAEKHFLGHKLTPNKKFVASSARAFVRNHDKKYDFILIDVFTNMVAIPQETTTREFLADTKKLLNKEGILVANIVSAPDFREKFTVRYHNTFASVFHVFSRQVIGDFSPWSTPENQSYVMRQGNMKNALYIFYNHDLVNDTTAYTDDVNPYSFDRD